ncbi:hypothetical protein CC86DRAFT_380505 [Ophiobolus disseminans]|uniref:Uncharacterized protein n=1 Tax=Ophiobolus disseminans TaxID=1469910 RepID=A0A6A7A615_9PLEO|nr:hypothetical protein CC86DRAFT_380505 [Ophiobolus disseminans]
MGVDEKGANLGFRFWVLSKKLKAEDFTDAVMERIYKLHVLARDGPGRFRPVELTPSNLPPEYSIAALDSLELHRRRRVRMGGNFKKYPIISQDLSWLSQDWVILKPNVQNTNRWRDICWARKMKTDDIRRRTGIVTGSFWKSMRCGGVPKQDLSALFFRHAVLREFATLNFFLELIALNSGL